MYCYFKYSCEILIRKFCPIAERVYKGSFVIVGGDKYTSSLADSLSEDFQDKAQAYKTRVSNSMLFVVFYKVIRDWYFVCR